MGFVSKTGTQDFVDVSISRGTSMKVAYCSDVHLEFGELNLENKENADVLVLAGDIFVAADVEHTPDPYGIVGNAKYDRIRNFFDTCSANFPMVLYIAGNHEHYHGDIALTHGIIRKFLEPYDNVKFLDKETFEYKGTVFAGCTLWTSMNNSDPLTLYQMRSMMNDFRVVKNSAQKIVKKVPIYDPEKKGTDQQFVVDHYERREYDAKWSPEDAVIEHNKCLEFLAKAYEECPPWNHFVVFTHHTPSFQSCAPEYKSDTVMNGGYHSELTDFIVERPGIKAWIHGHTHYKYDYVIGGTRILCNPRGYVRYEKIASEFTLKHLEF